MKKVMSIFIILLLIIVAVLLIGKNVIAKNAVTAGVKAVTGLQMDIGNMDVGLLKTLISVNEMKLYNPPGYPDKVMIDMPEIFVDYKLGSFIAKKAHLEEIRINLKELIVIKNRDGKLNIEALKAAQKEEKGKEEQKTEGKKTEIIIDTLDLKIGKVAYKDFSRGPNPKITEYSLNLHETLHNVTDLNELGKLILVKALMYTNIASLANFDINSLKSGIPDTLMKAADISKPVEDIGKKTGEALQETTKGIKEKLKLPFGK
jgi:uncharacterized protein involved in outer membrane biogenesis